MPDLRHTIVYKAVHGAVMNTLHAHPRNQVTPNFARSVSKRAAGTLAGMNPGVALAAARQSGQRARFLGVVSISDLATSHLEGAAQALPARLLKFSQMAIEKRIAVAKKNGDASRYLALCTAARILKQEIAIMAGGKDE